MISDQEPLSQTDESINQQALKLLGEIVGMLREDLYSTQKTKNLDEKILEVADRMDGQP